MTPLDFSFDDADLDRVLSGPAAEPPSEEISASEDLAVLTRRIAGQYGEVLAGFASRTFAGREAGVPAVRAAVANLRRLASAGNDADFREVLERLDALVAEIPPPGRARERHLRDLRDVLLAVADHLEPADAERLRSLVRFDRKALPLLDELSGLPGIGPRRLERLYCAGLFTVEAVGTARPDDVALVTGLPRGLAAAVVEATRRYAADRRRRCLLDVRQRTAELLDVLRGPQPTPAEAAELLALAQAARTDLEHVLATLGEEG